MSARGRLRHVCYSDIAFSTILTVLFLLRCLKTFYDVQLALSQTLSVVHIICVKVYNGHLHNIIDQWTYPCHIRYYIIKGRAPEIELR